MRAPMRMPIAASALIGLLILLVGCSTLRPLSTERTLDGYLAKSSSIIVLEAYSFKPGLVIHTLPAGTYTPILEDDHGIYYQSSSKLLLGDLFGPTLQDGGLFFKGGVLSEVYEYIIISGRHSKWKLPSDFKFRVERNSK